MRVGSLFSGIGGFDLGLERAGFTVAWQAEAIPYRRAVLRHHWPDVPCFTDVHDVNPDSAEPVDLICGGFPCQDISLAGKGAGIDGARSGLWSEIERCVRLFEPRWVVVENVPALTSRGLDRVLRDLAACGYDAEWDCLPASAFGAPHRRNRIWVVAYPQRGELWLQPAGLPRSRRPAVVANNGSTRHVADAQSVNRRAGAGPPTRPEPSDGGWWASEPDVGRVAHGVPARVDRLAALGDSLVPQIAEWIGRRLMAYEDATPPERSEGHSLLPPS